MLLALVVLQSCVTQDVLLALVVLQMCHAGRNAGSGSVTNVSRKWYAIKDAHSAPETPGRTPRRIIFVAFWFVFPIKEAKHIVIVGQMKPPRSVSWWWWRRVWIACAL
jgi:hypothetical protein